MPKHWKRAQPPLRTAEIRAFNYGARAKARGLNLDAIAPLGPYPPLLELEPSELDAVGALGPEQFHRWVVRGWVEG